MSILIALVIGLVVGIFIGLPDDCPEAYRHDWHEQWNWNNMLGLRSKYTGDLLSRKGKRCYHCGEFRWKQGDRDFIKANEHVTDHAWAEPECTWDHK
jgi:hypothetical protein